MQHPLTARREAQPIGVVDTLSAGYSALNRRLWILLVPILLDLFLWFGPQVSFAPLLDPILAQAGELSRQSRAAADPATGGALADVEALRRGLMAMTSEVNVLGVMALGPLSVPSAVVLLGGAGAYSFFVDGWGAGLALLVAALAVGLLLGGSLRAVIAEAVRQPEASAVGELVRAGLALPRHVLRVLGLVGLLLGLALLVGVPVMLVAGIATLVSPALGAFGVLLISTAVLFAQIHLFFAVDAIFVSRIGPWAAVRRSVAVVRHYFWATMGFILLSWLILAGMDRVWELLASSLGRPAGVLLSVLGNAYIATGLIAASMIFYRERDRALGARRARTED